MFPLEEEGLGKWGTAMREGSVFLTRDCRLLPHHPAPSGDQHEVLGMEAMALRSCCTLFYNVTLIYFIPKGPSAPLFCLFSTYKPEHSLKV